MWNIVKVWIIAAITLAAAVPSSAAPESSTKEEAAASETHAADPSLTQAGTSTSARARIATAMRRAKPGAMCNGMDVLCAGSQGSVVVLPGAIINGDLINAPGSPPCPASDYRCRTRKP